MNSKRTLFAIIIGVFSVALFTASDVHAACENVPAGGNYTVSASCSFGGTIDGVDDGGMTVDADRSLLVQSGQTIIWGPGHTLLVNGSLVLNGSGKILKTRIWMHDEDSDGYASKIAAEASVSGSSPGSGYRLRKFMETYDFNDVSKIDCGDDPAVSGANKVYQLKGSMIEDLDRDRYKKSGSSSIQRCVGVGSSFGGKTYYKARSGNFDFLSSGDLLSGDDLDDADASTHSYNYSQSTYYNYSQSTYYAYSQGNYYSYSQSTYYAYSQSTYYNYSQGIYDKICTSSTGGAPFQHAYQNACTSYCGQFGVGGTTSCCVNGWRGSPCGSHAEGGRTSFNFNNCTAHGHGNYNPEYPAHAHHGVCLGGSHGGRSLICRCS